MSIIDSESTGLSPEVVAALSKQITVDFDTGQPTRVAYAEGGDVDVYVDGVNGDDANDGSRERPFKTIAQVYRGAPGAAFGGCKIVVHLAGLATKDAQVDYPAGQLLFNGHAFRGPDMIPAPVSVYTAALDAVPATSLTNRSRINFTTAAPNWSTNELRSYFLRVTRDGSLVFPELPIAENDADHIWVDVEGLNADILSTDLVEVVRPGARIVGTQSPFGFPILIVAGKSATGVFNSCCIEKIGFEDFVIVDPSAFLQFDRCMATAAYAMVFNGTCSLMNTSLAGDIFASGRMDNSPFSQRQDFLNGKVVDLLVVGGGIHVGDTKDRGVLVVSYNVSVYDNPNGHGIDCRSNGSFLRAESSASIQGSGNSGVGIVAQGGARVRLSSNAGKTTITGTGGDLKVGHGNAISYGTGVGEFREVAGWNGNFTRILEGTATAPLGDTSQIECVF